MPDTCSDCNRPMRRGKRPHLNPGEVRHDAKSLCHTCYVRSKYKPVAPTPRVPATLEVDESIVDAALAGRRPTMNTVELDRAVSLLSRYRLSARQIAERLGCTDRVVRYHRMRLRDIAARPS